MKTCKIHCSPVNQSVTRCIAACGYRSATKYTKTYIRPQYKSGTQGIATCHLERMPKYQSVTEYTKTCKLHCYPVYQSVTRGIDPWHLECIPEYQSATKYMKTCQLHCTPVSVSNAGYSGLSPGLYTRISVSDKVYEDQCPLNCYPVYQSVTQGIVSCHLKRTPEYQSTTMYMKSCQLHCTPMYQSVTWGIHLECIDLPEYRSTTKYTKTCQLHCSPVYQSANRDIKQCFFVYIVADRYSLVYTLGVRPLYIGLLTDIPGSSVAYMYSYTLSLSDIPAYTPGDRPLYPRLQTNILGNSVADRYSYTLSLTGIRVCTTGDSRLYLSTDLIILCRWPTFWSRGEAAIP